jgi:Cu/Ag efflux protein CusF
MSKRLVSIVALCLLTATAAHAQYGGGGGGGGGRRGGGGGGGGRSGGGGQSAPATPAPPPAKPLSRIEIIGVIQAIDAANNRLTIAYEDVEALNWPAGTKPFVVGKTEMLKDVTVGEKVRFKLESQQISALTPY